MAIGVKDQTGWRKLIPPEKDGTLDGILQRRSAPVSVFQILTT